GKCVGAYLAELRAIAGHVQAANDPSFGASGARLGEALDALDRATQWMLANVESNAEAALAGATPYLRLFGVTAGGVMLADEALAAQRIGNGADAAGRVCLARFFAENICVGAGGLERTAVEGAESVNAAKAALEE
ncbi:MAG: acyl-CoA dehydrogenase C-terminal domain-containing protein, partial [Xanthobacteraceae bacterium]